MLKVFEAFSGIGTQRMALNNINIDFKIVATSEIDVNAIIAYANIHNAEKLSNIQSPNISEVKEYLRNLNILSEDKVNKLSIHNLENLYKCSIANCNFGDISKINIDNIPDHDLFTYSFPCQDLSTFGTKLGCEENSGTRSSLLWSCKSIIEAKKPKFLLLENVRNLLSSTHVNNFQKWLDSLSNMGYKNFYKILDSADFGIPQRRKRVFVVSILNEEFQDINYNFPNNKSLQHIEEFIDLNLEFQEYDKHMELVNKNIPENKLMFLDDRDFRFNGVMISDICSTQRAGRTGLKVCYRDKEKIMYRNITWVESWKLMGIADSYINKIHGILPNGALYKLAGNAIVVNVLEEIFKEIFSDLFNFKLEICKVS